MSTAEQFEKLVELFQAKFNFLTYKEAVVAINSAPKCQLSVNKEYIAIISKTLYGFTFVRKADGHEIRIPFCPVFSCTDACGATKACAHFRVPAGSMTFDDVEDPLFGTVALPPDELPDCKKEFQKAFLNARDMEKRKRRKRNDAFIDTIDVNTQEGIMKAYKFIDSLPTRSIATEDAAFSLLPLSKTGFQSHNTITVTTRYVSYKLCSVVGCFKRGVHHTRGTWACEAHKDAPKPTAGHFNFFESKNVMRIVLCELMHHLFAADFESLSRELKWVNLLRALYVRKTFKCIEFTDRHMLILHSTNTKTAMCLCEFCIQRAEAQDFTNSGDGGGLEMITKNNICKDHIATGHKMRTLLPLITSGVMYGCLEFDQQWIKTFQTSLILTASDDESVDAAFQSIATESRSFTSCPVGSPN